VAKSKGKPQLDERYWRLMRRVAGNIRRIREAKGLTQEDMTSLGFERRWYQRIESGTYSVSLPTLDQLARALKIDVSELFRSR
jgi:transcriptional regulator with XRE-family HTH domain